MRQEESLDLLIALNSGLPGMCSVHANSAREAVIKLCTLPLLAGENVTAAFVVPTVATSIDLVVQVGIDPGGHRRVREIVALPGRVENGVVEIADIFTSRGNELVRAEGYPAARRPLRPARHRPARPAGRPHRLKRIVATSEIPDAATMALQISLSCRNFQPFGMRCRIT